MKKLLIIDSNSILNRAFYGVRYLSSSDGTPTNAVYGFLNILFKLFQEEKPDYVCAAFDLKAPTFRHKLYDGYKAQRKPMPDELRVQMPIAKEILSAMDIPILQLEGYEADDIIGTVSRLCEEQDTQCLIATGDKDDLQLASEQTKVILTVTRQGVNDTTVYDRQAVKERYQVTPEEFIDVKALMGDPSDNIPGVAGIGEKTAVQLIGKFHSVEKLYENLVPENFTKSQYQKLSQGKDSAFLSKTLATIDRNVPIPFEMEDCAFAPERYGENTALYELLSRLELRSIMKKLNLQPQADTALRTDYFSEMQQIRVTDASALSALAEEIQEEGRLSLLLSWSGSGLLSAALSWGRKAAVLKAGGKLSENELFAFLIPLLEKPQIKKLTFHVKEDMVRLMERCEIRGVEADLALAAYLIHPEKSEYTMRSVVQDVLKLELQEQPQKKKEQLSLLEDDEQEEEGPAQYQAVYLMPIVWEKLQQELEKQEQTALYREVELPLSGVLAKMQCRGFKVEPDELQRFGSQLSTQIDRLTSEIYELAGETFNINSPKQLGTVLFERLQLPVIKKTKTGYATNADVLEKLMPLHPIIGLISEFRQLSKLKSTYCDGLAAVINPKTGKIHSVFTQTVTVTGRISSTEPNMQNIPTRTELGRELRKMFVASDDAHILVDADYSQIELRVLAHIADDQTMLDAFRNNEDIHAVTASQVFGVPLADVTREQRSYAKAVNFGIVYGIGEFSLSQDIHVSVREAKRYIESYLEKYHGVASYMEQIKKTAKENGYVKTLMNRIRYIPELKSSNFNVRAFGERVALNTPIQGTAADIIKLAMVRVEERMCREGLQSQLVLQVHDELIVDALKTEEEQVKTILQEEMEHAMTLNVPLKVDMESGRSWYDTK